MRFVNGMIEVGEEDFVDFYHNLMTVKVKCLTNVKAVSIDTAQEVEDGTEVVSVGRGFLGTLVEGRGILHKEYPYFGCQELWGSNCQGSTWVTTEVNNILLSLLLYFYVIQGYYVVFGIIVSVVTINL